jgi:HD-like signal output (HDOD) protein
MTRILSAFKRLFFTPGTGPNDTAIAAECALSDEPAALDPKLSLLPKQVVEMFYESILGQPPLDHKLGSLDQKRLTLLAKRLGDEGQLSHYAPRLPLVVPQLLRSLRNVNSSAAQQAEIISQDPTIASSVLRAANSPRFNNAGVPIDSFQRAIVALGNNEVRGILSTVAMQPIMEISSKHYRMFGRHIWQHALSSAVCAQLLARQRGVDPFQAYMAGLIHNIGACTVFIQLMREAENEQVPSPVLLYRAIDRLGADTSIRLARLWEFDSDIVCALEEIERSDDSKSGLGEVLGVSRQLCLAYSLWLNKLLSQDQLDALSIQYHQPKNFFEQLKQLLAE